MTCHKENIWKVSTSDEPRLHVSSGYLGSSGQNTKKGASGLREHTCLTTDVDKINTQFTT